MAERVPSVKRSGIAPALFSDCFLKNAASHLLVLDRISLHMSPTRAQQQKLPCPLTIQNETLKLTQAFQRPFSLLKQNLQR